MSLVSKSVLEVSCPVLKCFDNICRDEYGAKGSVAARDSLPDKNNIRLDAPVLHGERLAGPAHAAHDFICDKENVTRAANLGDPSDIAVWRHDSAESCSNNWLENESGGG